MRPEPPHSLGVQLSEPLARYRLPRGALNHGAVPCGRMGRDQNFPIATALGLFVRLQFLSQWHLSNGHKVELSGV